MGARELHQTKYVRGTQLVQAKELACLIKNRFGERGLFGKKVKGLKLTKTLTLPDAVITSHICILGTTGVGKSTLIKTLLEQVREKHPDDLAIIFDIKGEYLSAFYKDGDLIFNPLDKRCIHWNLFSDIKDTIEISDIARAFIPLKEGQNSYFYNAAKDVFASILEILWKKQEWSYERLWEVITMNPRDLLEFLTKNSHLGGAIGAQHISKPDSPQTQGVIATAIEHLHPIRTLIGLLDKNNGISLREWLQKGKGWLFLPYLPAYSSLLAPLFTALVNLLMIESLMQPDYPPRRIFFVLDELGNLLTLPKLSTIVAVGRSKNVSVWLGTQTIAKLDVRYTPGVCKDVLNNCNTKILFRVTDPDTAKFCEQLLGQQEFEERKKSYSLGVENVRDGVSFQRVDVTKPIVLASEFYNLPNLHFFIKIADLPPAKDVLIFKKFLAKIETFIKRNIPEPSQLKEEIETKQKKQLKPEQKTEQLEKETQKDYEKGHEPEFNNGGNEEDQGLSY